MPPRAGVCSTAFLTCDERVHLLDQLLFLLCLERVVPLGQTGLARAVLDQDELDGHGDGEEEEGED